MIGLDTTAIIDLFKGDSLLKDVLAVQKESFATAQLIYLELLFGIDPNVKAHQEEKIYYDEFFKSLVVFQLDTTTCVKASEIYWKLKKKGKIIGKFDCVIAATLLENGITQIITRNVKHFQQIPEMKVITY